MNDAERIVILADLHLAPGSTDRSDRRGGASWDDVVARFIDQLAPAMDVGRHRLVLLGDTFDLVATEAATSASDTTAAATIARMDAIAESHPRIIIALRAAAARGMSIDVVCGNHDIELVHPEAKHRLSALLDLGPSRLRVHPWILYIPGVLYAEHGSQHHDINASPAVTAPFRFDGGPTQVERSLAAQVARCVDDLRAAAGLGRRLGGAVGLARLAGRNTAVGQLRRRREHQATLADRALEIGLPEATLRQLDGLSRFGLRSIAIRLGHRAVAWSLARWCTRTVPAAHPARYLHVAWPRVVRILEAHGCAVPFYVFGHTHVAEARGLAGHDAVYLNPGSWTLPKNLGRRASVASLQLVEICSERESVVRGRLLIWHR